MADKFLFQNDSPEERKRSLQSTADNVQEDKKFYKKLDASDLIQKRKEFTDKSLKLSDLDEEKKTMVKDFKDQMDPIKTEVRALGSEVRTGHAQFKGNLYGFVDSETLMVYFYSESGELIETETRPANEEELGLFSHMRIVKDGTHN